MPATKEKPDTLTARQLGFRIRPVAGRIAVLPDEAEGISKGGIVIPDQAKERPIRGEVVAVGPGKVQDGARVPLDVAVGDRVAFEAYGTATVEIEGTKVKLLTEEQVLAVLS